MMESQILMEEGIFVAGFAYPVVPRGKALIRSIVTSEQSTSDREKALAAYLKTRWESSRHQRIYTIYYSNNGLT